MCEKKKEEEGVGDDDVAGENFKFSLSISLWDKRKNSVVVIIIITARVYGCFYERFYTRYKTKISAKFIYYYKT